MKPLYFILVLVLLCILVPFSSAAHYIVGQVNDSYDGESADNHSVVLWNPVYGINDNLTDIIGSEGNSGADNIYMIDCELLDNGCDTGDILNIEVIDTGDSYVTENVSVVVTGAGYDIAPGLRLNSILNISSALVDDFILSPENEIDLIAASTQEVGCSAVIEDLDNNLDNVWGVFYADSSFYEDDNDNNEHYTNDSCFINSSYGNVNESEVICKYNVHYYAYSDNWTCIINANDILGVESNASDGTFINSLLSVGAVSSINYGDLTGDSVSNESVLNITNYGNVDIDLSLYGYGNEEGDNYSMVCDSGNISVEYQKYNLTSPNTGEMGFSELEDVYYNLSSESVLRSFNLDMRRNDIVNNAINQTYWRIYAPSYVNGNCSGNIFIGAESS